MAKKKSGAKDMDASAETLLKPVRVELTTEIHRLLRKVAADEGISMAAFARITLERIVQEEAKKRGIKA